MLIKIPIKTAQEIELMKSACRVTAQILQDLYSFIVPGISTEQIDQFVHKKIIQAGGIPATLGYKGYPKSCCTSINEVICHGIPSPYEILKEGDIINVDVTTIKDGFHGDASCMYFVGGKEKCSKEAVELVEVTKQTLEVGIAQVKPGGRIGDIGAAIMDFIKSTKKNYGIVREYTGHGLGREFHEPPQVIHVGKRGQGDLMKPGMTFTIEPMINVGTHKTVLSTLDGWTVKTADGKLSAQWEHTVLVTDDGVEILTQV
jgi:methionyl aminopeptidase